MTKHRTLMTVLLAALLALAGVAASEADRGKKKIKTYTLPAKAGNPEGVAFDRRTGAFYVSEAQPGSDGVGGRVWRGRLGRKTLRAFLPASEDRPATIGMKVKRGKLYIAGGPAGDVEVYNISSKERVAQFHLCSTGCFVNDLIVARNGDVFVTESNLSQFVYRIPAEAVREGEGDVEEIPIAPPLVPVAGSPNANGIATRGRYVVFVQSAGGKLFRLDRRTRAVTEIPVTGGEVTNGDGIVLKKRTLWVVRNRDQLIAKVRLSRGFERARVVRTKTDDSFEDPTTAALAGKKRLLVVNSDFFPPPVGPPFTVSAIKAP
jgi:hypothetical protein